MNAVVAFCHFCESHGPQVVFCTEVFKENDLPTTEDSPTTQKDCPACTSIGVDMTFKSKDKNGIMFCSKQIASTNNLETLLKQACMRSLSCEVSTTKENALVFFGDSIRGYVLSYSFQLRDTRARGLKRLFSIIILMRDKMYLLNLTTHFSNEMQITAKELETLSNDIYNKEQATCSQRAFRLRRGKMDSEPPRSLEKLTGKKNVFGYIHIRSSYMLSSASKIYTEVSCNDLLPVAPSEKSNQNKTHMSLRQLEEFLTGDIFLKVVYCTLIGLQVVVRGDSDKCNAIICTLETLLPTNSNCTEYADYVPPTISRLFSCKSPVAVPQPCSGVCRIDIVNEMPIIHWCADLPPKWPTLMNSIVKGIHEKGFSDSTLELHISSLREEWKNNAMALKCVQHSSTVIISSIKQSLGIKAQDEPLLEYWVSNFVI